jgi:hypothetical protein
LHLPRGAFQTSAKIVGQAHGELSSHGQPPFECIVVQCDASSMRAIAQEAGVLVVGSAHQPGHRDSLQPDGLLTAPLAPGHHHHR